VSQKTLGTFDLIYPWLRLTWWWRWRDRQLTRWRKGTLPQFSNRKPR
jgi:hypothetical protein